MSVITYSAVHRMMLTVASVQKQIVIEEIELFDVICSGFVLNSMLYYLHRNVYGFVIIYSFSIVRDWYEKVFIIFYLCCVISFTLWL